MRALTLVIVAGLVGFTPQQALPKDHDSKEKKHWKHGDDDDDRGRHGRYGEACFSEEYVRAIRDYYGPRGLPPGLQKKYYRTGHLPPGWEKKVQPFPYEVERRLPPVCSECARGYVDGYAVIYQPRSRVIIDVHAIFAP